MRRRRRGWVGKASLAVWCSMVAVGAAGAAGRTAHTPLNQMRCKGARARHMGLEVLLDMAANHLSDQSAYYREAQRRGRKSPYYDWFERDGSGRPVHYFDWTHLENLNYRNPAVRNYVLAAFSYWLADYHVDGFRLDAAWAIRQRVHLPAGTLDLPAHGGVIVLARG